MNQLINNAFYEEEIKEFEIIKEMIGNQRRYIADFSWVNGNWLPILISVSSFILGGIFIVLSQYFSNEWYGLAFYLVSVPLFITSIAMRLCFGQQNRQIYKSLKSLNNKNTNGVENFIQYLRLRLLCGHIAESKTQHYLEICIVFVVSEVISVIFHLQSIGIGIIACGAILTYRETYSIIKPTDYDITRRALKAATIFTKKTTPPAWQLL